MKLDSHLHWKTGEDENFQSGNLEVLPKSMGILGQSGKNYISENKKNRFSMKSIKIVVSLHIYKKIYLV